MLCRPALDAAADEAESTTKEAESEEPKGEDVQINSVEAALEAA